MDYGHIPGVNKPVSRLVQGTTMISFRKVKPSFDLLDAVVAWGCNTLDTAHVYMPPDIGDSERTIGKWLAQRGIRDQLVIIGKGAHHNDDRQRVTPFDISADLHDSLARLQTDYIDLYLLHRDDLTQPVGPLVETLNEHYAAGRIKAFGGSNWTHTRIQAANAYAAAHGLQPFVASSPQFSLTEIVEPPFPGFVTLTRPENQPARDWYAQTQMPMFAYWALAAGFLSGKFSREFPPPERDIRRRCFSADPNYQRLDRARQLAAEHGVSLLSIAVAYVLNQPMNSFALVGAHDGKQFEDALPGASLKLDAAALAWLAGTEPA
jgi:aryl-alcohol dehydrogenase-like predicted oxidoreductase